MRKPPEGLSVETQHWQTEPAISPERQQFLRERLQTQSDIQRGVFPFGGIALARADIEWLLVNHEDGRGPVEWHEPADRTREGLDLRGAQLRGVVLNHLPLAKTHFGLRGSQYISATSEIIDAAAAHLEGAQLIGASLEEARLAGAFLTEADCSEARLDQASLYVAHIEGTKFTRAHLAGANFRRTIMNEQTNFYHAIFSDEQSGAIAVRDALWRGADVTSIDWSTVKRLGDEDRIYSEDKMSVVRAYRQVSRLLREQSMTEEADRFALRSLHLNRRVLRNDRKLGAYLGSLGLDLLAGYGYRPGRSFLIYLAVILGFMGLFLLNAQVVAPHLTWDEALVLSISSFHGRGFFSQNISLGDTYARLAAVEAVIGLIVEISFIATFTNRFFARQ